MKVRCKKTNITFKVSSFNNYFIDSTHPIFNASYDTLMEISKDWHAGKLDETERHLLFVALLDSTSLLEWHSPAVPTDVTIQKNMQYLLRTTSWINAIGSRIRLPHIAINHATCSLENVGNWLDSWNNAQREYTTGSHMLSVREKMEKAQIKLRDMIRANKQDSRLYAKHMANWFMIASNAPKALHDYWTSLFMLERPAIWSASLPDLIELKEHFEEYIPINAPICVDCYRHICRLVDECEGGVLKALTGDTTYTIVSDPIEEYNIEVAASYATSEKPEKKDFLQIGDYIRAYASWKLRSNMDIDIAQRNA